MNVPLFAFHIQVLYSSNLRSFIFSNGNFSLKDFLSSAAFSFISAYLSIFSLIKSIGFTLSFWIYYKIKNTIDEVEDLFYDNKRNYKDYKISSILEEVNLMYVAITRAIKELTINSDAINELLEVKRKDFNKYLHYKLVSLSSEHLKLSAWLLDSFVDDKTILVRNPKNIGGEWLVLWIEYSFCSTYVFNSIVKINNDKKRRRVLKNWKWLVVTFKSRNLNNKLNISYRNSWYTLKPKIKLSNIVEKFPEIKVDEWEFAEALCFDIKDSWIWEWELVIKTHKNNWIVFDVSDFSIIKKDVLEE